VEREKGNVIALVSGGKDSTFALEIAIDNGMNVTKLFTMFPQRRDSYMFHTPALSIVPLFSKAVEIPLVTAETEGTPEKEFDDLLDALIPLHPDVLIGGAIASQYQYRRLKRISKVLGCELFFPLWHMAPTELLDNLLARRYSIIFSAVSAMGLNKDWLAKKLNTDTVKMLMKLAGTYGVHPAGEGGEYETLVLDAPFFKARIVLDSLKKEWDGMAGHIVVEQAHLEAKNND